MKEVTKMKLSKQIKKYRTETNLSQEELADKIYVSRQTISNWENEKNYVLHPSYNGGQPHLPLTPPG